MDRLDIEKDAFSDGQIGSKLWLCQEFEKVASQSELSKLVLKIAVIAGWNGVLPFLLFSRERMKIEKIDLFDLDDSAVQRARLINDKWRIERKFFAHVQDVNLGFEKIGTQPDVWINTSCEHFLKQTWFDHIPNGSIIALQGTNMKHQDHIYEFKNLETFKDTFGPWADIFFEGEKKFDYGEFKFTRFMVIGRKAW